MPSAAPCEYFRFMSGKDIERCYSDARVVVCHAGTGSILKTLEHKKPLVLVPRLRKYNEVFDDHQLEVARQMEAQGVTVVHEIGNLENAIRSTNTSPQQLNAGGTLVERLKEYIDQIDK